MPYKHQSTASPLKRIRLARGFNVMQLSVYSGVAMATLRKIDQIDPKIIGDVKIKSLMRIAACLQCAPTDLVPFLAATVKKKIDFSSNGRKPMKRQPGRPPKNP